MEVITFEIAKKLKEKGFDYKCLFVYNKEQIINPEVVKTFGELSDDGYYELTKDGGGELDWDFVYVNNYQLIQYRDVIIPREMIKAPTISQVLKWLREEKKIAINIEFIPYVWQYKILDMSFENRFEPCGLTLFSNYEEAAITGIEYVLDNLIS
jgi:hypothetical protein